MTKNITPGSYHVSVTTQVTYLVRGLEQHEIDKNGEYGDESLLLWAINEDEELVSRDNMEILDWYKVED